MSETTEQGKHTPGPWHFAYDGPSLPIVCTENEIIALVRTGRTNENTEIEANARLIAAAPELLECLRDCKRWIEMAVKDLGLDSIMPEKIEAIIAKAEGK